MQDTRHWAALALTPEEKMSVEDPVEMERLADALPLERAASRWIVSSDPGRAGREDRPYVELGFRHLVFHAPGPDQERFLRLYGEQVLPRLRKQLRMSRNRAARREHAWAVARHLPDGQARATTSPALIAAATCDARGTRSRATATCWWWRRRSSPRPRAATSISPPSKPSARGDRAGRRGRRRTRGWSR